MGSGGGDSVQSREPWAAQRPYLEGGFHQASNLFRAGGPQYFPDATYIPFSQQTEQGLGMTENRAMQGSPVTQAAQNLATNSMTANPQFAGGTNYLAGGPTLDQYSNFAGVSQPYGANPAFQNSAGVGSTMSLDQARNVFDQSLTGLPSQTQNALANTASGQSLHGNPYLDQQFDLAAQKVTDTFNRDISPGIAAQFSLAGRTGSDAMADVQTHAAGEVSDSLARLANQIYGGNYQAERDRQLNAAGQLGGLSQAQQGLGLQAAGQGANLYNQGQQQDIQRRGMEQQGNLTARGQDIQSSQFGASQDLSRRQLAGQLFNQGQGNQLQAANIDANVYGQQLGQQNTMASLANPLANQDYTDIDRLMGVGARVEGLGQQALQDRINRFNHYQYLPQNNLANYIASIQGNYGGTTTGHAPGGNPLQGAAGGALAGSQFGVPGALIGGALGYLRSR